MVFPAPSLRWLFSALTLLVTALTGHAETIGHWRFEVSPGLTADSSGRGLTLSPLGSPTAYPLPVNGPGSAFDRTLPQTGAANSRAANLGPPDFGQFSRSDSAIFRVTDFTIEAYVRRTAETVGTQYIASQWDFTNGNERSWGLGVGGSSPPSGISPGELFFVLSASGSGNTVIGSGLFVGLDTDFFVAASIEADNPAAGVVFYLKNLTVGGVLTSSIRENPIGTVHNSNADFLIGAYNGGGNRWHGLVDEIRLSNAVLVSVQLLSEIPGPLPVSAPLVSPGSGLFLDDVTVTLSTSTPAATIHYTTDGTTPTTSSPLYVLPFTLSDSATVTARAFKSGFADSALVAATYTRSGLTPAGTVKPVHARNVVDSNWSVGGETVDRDYTVFAAYREWLGPLGAKRIRQQAGWFKVERTIGVYDWAWLDECVDGALAQGVQPWLETNYGNPIYPGGGGSGLGAGLPVSETALAAWDRWVEALVDRYKDRVTEWEVWNEPDNSGGQVTPEAYANFFIRTAEIIRARQPNSRIYALAVTYPSSGPSSYVGRFFAVLAAAGKLDLVDAVTAHAYPQNPDTSQSGFVAMRNWVNENYYPDAPIEVRQGESGAPSQFQPSFALANYAWTELSQAKWNARRLLGDLGHDIPSSIFAIIDMLYYETVWNYKGLLKAAADKSVDYPKEAYFAMRNIFSIFDNSLTRIPDFSHTANTSISRRVFAYRKAVTGKTVATIWFSNATPSNSNALTPVNFTLSPADIDDPVWVDIRTGIVRSIPAAQWSRTGDSCTFTGIPVYDSPILIADRSAIPLATPLDDWKRENFTVPQSGDETIAGNTADPDGDGIANLLEYATDQSPFSSAASFAQPTIAVTPEGRLSLTFQRLRADLTYIVEGSGILDDWSPVATNPGAVGETVTVIDNAPGTPTRRFLRLRITNP